MGRRKSLYLDAGLRVLVRKSSEYFRAIIRHELAHIVNRDVGRTYFAQALWIAVVIVTILPLLVSSSYLLISSAISQIADGLTSMELQRILFVRFPTYFGVMIRLAGLIILILLIRAGLLRTRELYADWRAALWGSASVLTSIFEVQGHLKHTGLKPFRLHPSPAERLHSLKDPRALFVLNSDVPFTVGVFTSMILNGLIPVILPAMTTVGPGLNALNAAMIQYARLNLSDEFLLLSPFFVALNLLSWGLVLVLGFVPFLILAPLAAATVGLQVQRQTLADLAGRNEGIRPYLALALPAAWIGLGILVGTLLTPAAVLLPTSWSGGLLAFLFLIAFVFAVWLALIYTRFFSRRLLGSHAGTAPPTGNRRLLSTAIGMLFLIIEVPLAVAWIFSARLPPSDALLGFLILSAISAAGLLLMASSFALHWITYRIYRHIRPVRCAACWTPSPGDMVAGRACRNCGEQMTPWLFVRV